ncbi:hypothetical protein [Parvibaculum sp.]|jgi:hypothetical protein|uniref:hypothetical protein n=1 Tax=Parvibaculum sp. TaxID=2024848 RepID=UPI000C89E9E5|nr:hypothetical protein [Parvibaculum sp.]MAB12586.1 hypothetical protein [Parvibaculum sp.]
MLDLLHDIETEVEGGWEAASRAELHQAEETRRSVARFTRVMWLSAFLLLFFNSSQLVTYVNGFEVGPVQDAVVALSHTWDEQMRKNGLTAPAAAIRAEVDDLRTTGWAELRAEFPVVERAIAALRGKPRAEDDALPGGLRDTQG